MYGLVADPLSVAVSVAVLTAVTWPRKTWAVSALVVPVNEVPSLVQVAFELDRAVAKTVLTRGIPG